MSESDSSLQSTAAAPVRPKPLPQFVWPLLTFLAIVGAGLLVALNERREFKADLREDTGLVREQLARRFEIVISDEIRPIRRFRRDILSTNIDAPLRFQRSCQSLQHEIPSYQQIWWLDARGVCIAASPEPQSQALIGHRLGDQPGWQAVGAAIESKIDSLAVLDTDQLAPRQVVILPIKRDEDQALVGYVAGRLEVGVPLSCLVDPDTADRFDIEVRDGVGNIILPHHSSIARPAEFAADEPIHILTATWHVTIWPLEQFVMNKPLRAEWLAFWGSLAMGFVAAWGVWQAKVHRRRDNAYRSAIEALSDITAAIAEAPEKEREVLQRLTQIAADMLEMPICVFSLWEESTQHFRVIYRKGPNIALGKECYSMEELPASREAFRVGHVVFASDIMNEPSCFDREASERHGIRSSIIMPLQFEGRPVGVIAVSDTQPRKLSKSDLRLVNLWSAQAAVTVVNGELHRQTRFDAQAKVVLLRELNHRVKNNLAGIAGLLCTSPVELPTEVRHWLDRVIERVSGMSRLHELLIDGAQMISVPDLVRKAVDSATILWPSDVRMALDLQGGQASLSTDRAVTLAMVLHELLFNALRHGVCDHGTVWVNSRVEESHVIIDVIDDASGEQGKRDRAPITTSTGAQAAVMDLPAIRVGGQTGLGLQLVRGLVGRELRGQFIFSTLPDGRTLARVIFQITP